VKEGIKGIKKAACANTGKNAKKYVEKEKYTGTQYDCERPT
jgi:hypothetical protein